MTLAAGTKLGPYEILGALGAGGMGEVYRARDTRLDRTVAIKVLPAHLSENANLRQRFEREARALSSLSHPNICTLHDIGREGDIDFLVLEYLEGESLAQRLERGPLPAHEVLAIGRQIADALDKAHRQGVVHRDLKPGNILLTKTGAKLLDFGLAKPAANAVASTLSQISGAATISQAQPLTAEGTIVGTFNFMAPEQLEGQEADARSDIFALGAVLYEMATGRRAFPGKSQASIIAAILSSEPPPMTTLQPMTPPALDRLVRTCLAKDPDERFQSAHDLKLQLEWVAEGGSQAGIPAPVAVRRRRHERLAWAAAAVLFLAAVGFALAYFHLAGVQAPVITSSILPPPDTGFNFVGDFAGPAVLSPDGRAVAFVAGGKGAQSLLWVRRLDSGVAQSLAGTEGASFPFWAPDSRSLGFFADSKLKRVDVAGGAPLTLCDAPNGRGGAWSPSGVIVFAPDFRTGIFKVAANGGTPQPVTQIDAAKYTTNRWPTMLPDGKHFLYLATNHDASKRELSALFWASIDGKENREVVRTQGQGGYASGYLLYLRDTSLMAQRFDPAHGRLRGDPVPAVSNVQYDSSTWHGVFSVSPAGLLLYQPATQASQSKLVWYDRSGRELSQVGPGGGPSYADVQLSPDGHRLAYDETGGPNVDIWVADLDRKTRTRLTFAPSSDVAPIWTPDGSRIIYTSAGITADSTNIYEKLANGAGSEELILKSKSPVFGEDISPDGRYLLFSKRAAFPTPAGADLYVLPLFGDHEPIPYLVTPFDEYDARFSPDGHWVVYSSNESGQTQVYVRPFSPGAPAGSGGKWQISTNGGIVGRWSHDGKQIYYLGAGLEMMSVPVTARGTSLEVGTPQPLFATGCNTAGVCYDVSHDGRRFIINDVGGSSTPLNLVINWTISLPAP